MTIGNLTALRQRTRISFAIADLALLFTDIIYSLLYNCIALTDSVTTIFYLGLFIPSDFRYFTTWSYRRVCTQCTCEKKKKVM